MTEARAKNLWFKFGAGLVIGVGLPSVFCYWWYGTDVLIPIFWAVLTAFVLFLGVGIALMVMDGDGK